ncbi:MFS transporter [Pandoraea fibrosis]|uniref:MFS transporter n=1 Tax=Pandoraea fibrosis TaxID=1891094 RepID=A0ABX6HPK9_9BURK|nr:MFS transporter [Pandoraea fibrosis]QHE93601.1 MFS transporter [Pandoraea fibrosis]QHF12837.1 MFS transporter [Pandoraea fibrosis]
MQAYRKASPSLAQWGLVATLTLMTMLAQIDKNILVLMVVPIQRDFGVSDVQISFLIGAAFAVANIVVGLPAGWLADRFDRRLIIAAGVLVWSLAVAANAAATTFAVLVAARVIVGGAEALIPPSSYSLIRDGVEESRRARALSVYTMALILGTGLSLVLGGPMMSAIQSSGMKSIPLLGDVSAWQMTLFLIGLVGVPMSLMIFLSKDPGRQRDGAVDQRRGAHGITAYLWTHRAIFGPLFLFVVANAVITFGLAAWLPTVIVRRFHLGMKEIGLIQGSVLLVMGPIGLWLAGLAMERKGSALTGVARVGMVTSVAVAALTVTLALTETLLTFWVIDALVVLFSWTFMSVTSTIVARVVPTRSVGIVMAMVLVLNGLLGQGLSPTLIALVGRHLFDGNATSLPNAMAVVFAVAGVVALVASMALYRNLSRLSRNEDAVTPVATQVGAP